MVNPRWYLVAVDKDGLRGLVFEYTVPVHRTNQTIYTHSIAMVSDLKVEDLIRVKDEKLDHSFDNKYCSLLAVWEINESRVPATVQKYGYSAQDIVGFEFWVTAEYRYSPIFPIFDITSPLLIKKE